MLRAKHKRMAAEQEQIQNQLHLQQNPDAVWTDSGGSGSGGGSNNAGAVATQAGGWSWSHGPVNATGASAIVVEDEEVKSTKMSSSGGSDRSSDPNGIMLVLKLLKQLCEGHHLPAQVGCIPE